MEVEDVATGTGTAMDKVAAEEDGLEEEAEVGDCALPLSCNSTLSIHEAKTIVDFI